MGTEYLDGRPNVGLFEASPTNGLLTKGPNSDWAYDHSVNYGLHVKVVRKTADQTVNNSITLVAVDDLLWAVGASEVWAWDLYLYSNSSTVADVKIGWAVPAASLLPWQGFGTNAAGSDDIFSALGSGSTPGLYGGGAAEMIFCGRGLYIGGANAGNVQLQFAQNTAEVSDTKILANSCLIVAQLA